MATRDAGSAWVLLAAWTLTLSAAAAMVFGFGIWIVLIGLAAFGVASLRRSRRSESAPGNERRTTE